MAGEAALQAACMESVAGTVLSLQYTLCSESDAFCSDRNAGFPGDKILGERCLRRKTVVCP